MTGRPDSRAYGRCSVGIMQPYFFPYIGYFQLIAATDQWVVFDTAQYMRHGWINRNRILHPDAGPKYVILPLAKHAREAEIRELRLHESIDWKTRIMDQVRNYYRLRAPHFDEVMDLLDSLLDSSERELLPLLVGCLEGVCRHLDLPFEFRLASDVKFDPGTVAHPGQWALRISKSLGVDRYVNPIGGCEIFQPEEFEEAGIDLVFLEAGLEPYAQGTDEFHAGLSIIDVLMWNSVEDVQQRLHDHALTPGWVAHA